MTVWPREFNYSQSPTVTKSLNYRAKQKGEKYKNAEIIIPTIINETITSIIPQLALDLALSPATVVAYVKPFNYLSVGFSVKILTIIISPIENTKSIIQK